MLTRLHFRGMVCGLCLVQLTKVAKCAEGSGQLGQLACILKVMPPLLSE